MNLTEAEQAKDLGGFFAVSPKYDCPHITDENFTPDPIFFSNITIRTPCEECQNIGENWVCLKCGIVKCSRYVKEHMLLHTIESSHGISISFSDLSFWCYKCESYISSPELKDVLRSFQAKKFPSDVNSISKNLQEMSIKEENEEEIQKQKDEEKEEEIEKKLEDLKIEETKEYEINRIFKEKSLEELAFKLKSGVFKKIAIMAGAGISVNAGIPDFRSPGGFYSKVEKLGLPYPEAVFSIQYFRDNPEIFYSLSQDLLADNLKPTPTHYFYKLLEDKGQLMMCYTQNIDSLELAAGLSPLKLMQAHGHFDSAHCISCKKEADIQIVKDGIREKEVPYCENCGKPIKPDVVFFGEALPPIFKSRSFMLEEADLLIIMGTSLAVFPFAGLADLVDDKTPRVVINKVSGESSV